MSLKKFAPKDLVLNTMKAHPSCEFFIYDSKVYYNNAPEESGQFSANVLNVPSGHVSLYESNVDKLSGSNNFIYPFITKGSAGSSFKTAGPVSYTNEFAYGDELTGSYPLSASITREYITTPAASNNRHFFALKNRLNYYGVRSRHYVVSSSYGDKSLQTLNLISIPSIFYGSQIQPGTMSLKWYFSGSLAGELRDSRSNGELIQVSGANAGEVAGVVLYDEGFVMLTGSWGLNSETIGMVSGGVSDNPKWIYFGAGALDDVSATTADTDFVSASFKMDFKGTTETQVMTMHAHAHRGEANHSNNPTFLEYGQQQIQATSSQIYEENPNRTIKNIVSSSFEGFDAPFERQVYISRVAIYDDNKNLIGIATLSNPILKREADDISFKIKLDM